MFANSFNFVAAILNNEDFDILKRIVKRRLNMTNIKLRSATRKIELKLKHRNRRIDFIREYLNTS